MQRQILALILQARTITAVPLLCQEALLLTISVFFIFRKLHVNASRVLEGDPAERQTATIWQFCHILCVSSAIRTL